MTTIKNASKEITPPKLGTKNIRFVSFNVCGLRNVLKYEPWCQNRSLQFMFQQLRGDVLCFQEVRTQEKDVPYNMAIVPGYSGYFTFPHMKKGYSGVAIYVKDEIQVFHAEDGITGWLKSKDYPGMTYKNLEQLDKNASAEDPTMVNNIPPHHCIGGYPEDVDESLGKEIDSEGRSVVLDLGFCVVFGLYCPANSLGNKEEYRTNYFRILNQRIINLIIAGREVIVMGDMNVARDLFDSADGLEDYFKKWGRSVPAALSMKSMETHHLDAVRTWKMSTPERLMFSGWLETNEEKESSPAHQDKQARSRIPLLHDVCREKHPQKMSMYTCKFRRSA